MSKHLEAALINNINISNDDALWKGYPVVEHFDNCKKVVCADSSLSIDSKLLAQGFYWLGHWQIIVPFCSYNVLLCDLVENVKDKKIQNVGDLRVPAFDTRLVFLKVSDEINNFWELYKSFAKKYHNSVAFYLAIWEIKPRYKPLPAGEWLSEVNEK